jgi:hypothetical protein
MRTENKVEECPMETSKRLFGSAGLTLALLGMLHLATDILARNQGDMPAIFQDMAAYKIRMLGTYSLLQFYTGFSLIMGVMLVLYGLNVWLTARGSFSAIPKNMFTFNVMASLILFVLTVVYFHPLAYGFCLVAFLLFALSSLKRFQV